MSRWIDAWWSALPGHTSLERYSIGGNRRLPKYPLPLAGDYVSIGLFYSALLCEMGNLLALGEHGMSRGPRPKITDGVITLVALSMIGAPEALGPKIPHLLGEGMFYGGLAFAVLYVCWRWGPWLLCLSKSDGAEGHVNNAGGIYVGGDNSGSQSISVTTINNSPPPAVYAQIADQLNEIKCAIAAIEAHKSVISTLPDPLGVVRMVKEQHQRLANASAKLATMTGSPTAKEDLGARLHADLDLVLSNVGVIATPLGDALKLKTGPNTFRVLFPIPMRIPPNLTFYNIPEGIDPMVVENSKIGFTVIFTPQTTPVNTFDFAADAEL
jgi:hypothetical protein